MLDSKESILDLIVQRVTFAGDHKLANIALFLTKEAYCSHILIDLVREILRMKSIPQWAFRLLAAVSVRLIPCTSNSNRLNIDEIMANEIIYKIKYCLDSPGDASIYAVMILVNCVNALKTRPQVQIVRLNEILDMLAFFIHDKEAACQKENQLRLLASLEIVILILNADQQVVTFFHKRITSEILPYCSKIVNNNDSKTPMQEKLLENCTFVTEKMKLYSDS